MILSWQQIASTVISEILCRNSDGVVLDAEHGCFNNETLYSCIQVITCANKKAFVRLPEINPTLIRMCLDAGVAGLIFSTVETGRQACEIHDLCKFPKYGGKRGLGLVRENRWGEDSLVSKPPIIIAQIETKTGVENIDEIYKYSFDYYLIGPYDLSASIGIPGQFNNKKYIDMIDKIKLKIPIEKMAVHIPTDIEKQIKKYKGYGIIALGMDTTVLIEGYMELFKYA